MLAVFTLDGSVVPFTRSPVQELLQSELLQRCPSRERSMLTSLKSLETQALGVVEV